MIPTDGTFHVHVIITSTQVRRSKLRVAEFMGTSDDCLHLVITHTTSIPFVSTVGDNGINKI